MRSFTILAALLGAVSAAPAVGPRDELSFTIASPGGAQDVVVTNENTLNGTYHSSETTVLGNDTFHASNAMGGSLPLKFINNAGNGQVYAYVTGIDSEKRLVFVKGDGSLVYPSSGGSGAPVPIKEDVSISLPKKGGTFQMTLPIIMTSGRVYFSEEKQLSFFMVKTPDGDAVVQPSPTNVKDPSAGISWGFVEFSYTKDKQLFANISYVDFVGLILSMGLTVKDGAAQLTRGLAAGSVKKICDGLADQSKKDKYPWDRMCVANGAGQPIRVLSPDKYDVMNPNDFKNYWTGYVDKVWNQYTQKPLTIDTQGAGGKVQCKVSGDELKCGGGDNRAYKKPSAHDIWGCDGGPFKKQAGDSEVHLAVMARLCAAFVRSTLLSDGGDNQPGPDSSYYKTDPTSHYSRLVHQLEVDGKGYAFPYDDVNTGDKNAAGVVASGAADTLSVYIGAPPS
ncbi:Glucan endo-1,3-beta-glucosidase [Tolypocladium paradoxum]|uniref:Glucan endo-1,3-beta-glucosidase n=1 Tax=Tolypocladium paradoxum TaxID=94208 RepID=A0A2S4L3P7_9HYPO|nr:Glucan endo-1,3-beta-glucosidase [Tolypocladium paradoxum]